MSGACPASIPYFSTGQRAGEEEARASKQAPVVMLLPERLTDASLLRRLSCESIALPTGAVHGTIRTMREHEESDKVQSSAPRFNKRHCASDFLSLLRA
jgi:hypothetical protein